MSLPKTADLLLYATEYVIENNITEVFQKYDNSSIIYFMEHIDLIYS